MAFKLDDLTGKRFGKLTVLERCYDMPKRGSTVYWKCICDCGNETIATSLHLKNGDKKSCGCMRKNDLTGKKFGRLTVLKKDGKENGNQMYLCQCECGNTVRVYHSNLTRGLSKSCGCLQKEETSKRFTKHGMRNSKLYNTYTNMMNRCNDPKNKRYSSYGGRGIKVCDAWSQGFERFMEWALSSGYVEGLTIDRIDVDGDYCPKNCRWATVKQQANNQRKTIFIEIESQKKSLKEWTSFMGWKYGTYAARHRKEQFPFTEEEIEMIKIKIQRSEQLCHANPCADFAID